VSQADITRALHNHLAYGQFQELLDRMVADGDLDIFETQRRTSKIRYYFVKETRDE